MDRAENGGVGTWAGEWEGSDKERGIAICLWVREWEWAEAWPFGSERGLISISA